MQIQRQRFGFIPTTVQQDHIAMFSMTIVTQSTVLSSSHTTKWEHHIVDNSIHYLHPFQTTDAMAFHLEKRIYIFLSLPMPKLVNCHKQRITSATASHTKNNFL